MNKRIWIQLAFILGGFQLGHWMFGLYNTPDRGDAGLGLIFIVVPSMLLLALLALVVSFCTGKRLLIDCAITAMLVVLAWIAGLLLF